MLDDQGLEVHTTVNAGEIGVPVSFGWHPYLVIPGATRDQIELRLPEVSAIALDDAGLPEADRPSTPAGGLHVLADRSWDHCFSGLKDGDAVEMRGGGSGIRFEFLEEYRWLQLFSPEGAEYVCIEPMTAETGALCEGESLAPVVVPGGTFTARFRVAPIA